MVAVDLSVLEIESAIVHDVPVRQAGAAGGGPTFSEIDSELSQELRNYFRERSSEVWHRLLLRLCSILPLARPSPRLSHRFLMVRRTRY